MSVKTYERFLAENLAGEYCYYGPGSLVPLVRKLYDEGKSIQIVSTFLRTLGIDQRRMDYVIGVVFGQEANIQETSIFEDDVDDLISTDMEDDLAGKKKDDEEDKDKEDKDKDKEDDEEDDDEEDGADKSDATKLLKQILDDQEKMDKIKSILKEHKTSDMPSDLTPENIRAYEASLRDSLTNQNTNQ
jgi:hypothetical protein